MNFTPETAKESIERSNRLQRLEKNRDFKALILEGYLKEDVIRMNNMRRSGNASEEVRKSLMESLDGAAVLNDFFNVTHGMAQLADKWLKDYEIEVAEHGDDEDEVDAA